nr:hypothetical protein [uncultured Romboutsia sp.]
MNERKVFYSSKGGNILYGKFKDIYIPLVNKKIICNALNFYNPNYIKGKIYKIIIKIAVKLFNSKFFIKEYNYFFIDKNIEEELEKIDGYKYCAVCKREDNINKDYIFQLMDDDGNILGYGKYPGYDDKNEFVVKEVDNLNYINTLGIQCARIPRVLLFTKDKEIYIQSTEDNLKNDNGKLSIKHIDFLSELYEKTKVVYKFKDSRIYNKLTTISEKTNDEELIDLSTRILKKINLENIEYCYSHGDFYSPNIKINNDFLYVYDWECATLNTLYYDIFHYITNLDIVDNSKSKRLIVENVLYKNTDIDYFESENNIDKNLRTSMFILYLYNIIYDFSINMNVNKDSDGTLKNYKIVLNIMLEM